MKQTLEVIREATGPEILETDEYYAMMVTDLENRGKRPRKDYLDYAKAWIGFEGHDGLIYVSKNFNTYGIHDPYRGKTLIVRVKPGDKVQVLTGGKN